jgi:predicted ATP-dependent protease
MGARSLKADKVGIPRFKWRMRKAATLFDLSSHERARAALDFGLSMQTPGFNIFVLGPDRAGRMTETLAYLQECSAAQKPASDWVYLNNFLRPHRPKPFALPAGSGRQLRHAMTQFIAQLRTALKQTFESDAYQARVGAVTQRLTKKAETALSAVRTEAAAVGLGIFQGEQGPALAPVSEEGTALPWEKVPPEDRDALSANAKQLVEKLQSINKEISQDRASLMQAVTDITQDMARDACEILMRPLMAQFAGQGLNHWFVALEQDILENLRGFGPAVDPQGQPIPVEQPEQRYAVNLLVDNGDTNCPPVILESNPTYENLFGQIQYRPGASHLETDFTLIRPGALHRANGGVLVLRADALAAEQGSWQALIAALRDGVIRIEERHRQNALPVTGAPSPKAIPLSLKVVIVGTPALYYVGYSPSPDFRALFKVKADIAQDMPATAANLSVYGTVLTARAKTQNGRDLNADAVSYLLGLAARMIGDRTRLSASLELLDDLVAEAAARTPGKAALTQAHLIAARQDQEQRNNRVEVSSQDMIDRGMVMIATEGSVIGQINGLTVRDTGDHAFGGPSRITARASVGRHGVLNIERQIAMSGPIQQKGALVLQGYLSGLFARTAPLSFNCSITFEQNYGGVEGDSASMAELIAVLSDLAGAPLRQDLAITGSVNQRGDSQAVGGVHHKVEGFFKLCAARGLTGSQGVVVPHSVADGLVVDDAVRDAIAAGQFHLHTVRTVEEAAALMTGLSIGKPAKSGAYPPDTLYGRVQNQLAAFDTALFQREAALVRTADAE